MITKQFVMISMTSSKRAKLFIVNRLHTSFVVIIFQRPLVQGYLGLFFPYNVFENMPDCFDCSQASPMEEERVE